MIRRAIDLAFTVLFLVAVAYLFFIVPLDERTLYEHVRRVVATPEAQEMGSEVQRAGRRLGEKVQSEMTAP